MLQVKKLYNDIPPVVRRFVVRAAIVFVVWRLLYYFILGPAEIPDRQFTQLAVAGTEWLMSLIYPNVGSIGSSITINKEPVVNIASGCNALELVVVYVGFLICLPTNTKRFWAFALGGTALILAVNVLRCAALGVMFYNGHEMAEFAHHYLFKLIIYGVAFWLWVKYSKTYRADAK